MTAKKRYSSLLILFELWNLLRSSLIFLFFLFILKRDSTSTFIKYGRWAFLLVFSLTICSIFYKWWSRKYMLNEQAFTFYKGLFNKSEQTIPFSKIQNVNRHTSFFHRLFKMTSLHFETGMTGNLETIKFEVISQQEAMQMEKHVMLRQDVEEIDIDSPIDESIPNRVIHFQATTKDILKASFTSLSFLLLIPLIGSLYFKINELFNVEQKAEGLYNQIIGNWWVMVIIITILFIVSLLFGIVKTFLKYGKYEISSDDAYIYITKGVLDETAFSIAKERVQAIEITQSFMKRILGLAEVKLLTVGGTNIGGNSIETNTLYPFLPIKHAYKMLGEILPSYEITNEMERLPKKSFIIRFFKPSWFWLIVTIALSYFKPTIFKLDLLWMLIPIILLVIILAARVLDYLHTRYVLNDHFIQFKTGALSTSLFISKREKVIEVEMTQNMVQKKLQIASIAITNRGKPIHYKNVTDIPKADALMFIDWYKERKHEVLILKE